MAFCKFSTEFIANNETKVDNIFINDYLPFAPENCVKVYLYGLYLCNSGNVMDNNLASFAKQLNLDEQEVEDCFRYWQEEGLVQVLSTHPIEIRYIPLKNIISGTKLYKPEKYEIFNQQAQELFEGAREISKTEYGEYYDFLERFHVEQEALLMIMKYCIDSKKSAVNYKYILTVAKNWANEGVTTVKEVENKLCEFETQSSELGLLLSALNIRRTAYIEERSLYRKWTEELGYTPDVILFIAKKIKRGKGSFEKLDSLIMKYYALNLFSIIEIEGYENKKASLYDLAKKVNNAIGVYYENLETVVENYIVNWQALGFTDDAILKIAEYCRKASIRTLEGINDKMQKFYKLGILTVDSLHTYLAGIVQIDNEIQSILEKVNLSRKVNYIDRECYKTWKDTWKLSDELIDYATTLSVGKLQPIQYMNGILSTWFNKGITTVEKAKQEKVPAKVPERTLQGHSYTKEELDAMIQSIDEVEV